MESKATSVFTESEFRRFAICFMNTDAANVNWAKAAAEYDPQVKVQSFRTMTLRALKKIQGPTINVASGDEADSEIKLAKPKSPSKRKRKAPTVVAHADADGANGGGSDDEAETPPPAKKRATAVSAKGKAKGKKVTAEIEDEPVGLSALVPVKKESAGLDLEI